MADIRTPSAKPYSATAFPLSRAAWEALALSSSMLERRGRTLAPLSARRLADRLIAYRRQQGEAFAGITAGRLLALDLLHAVLRHMADLYCAEQVPGSLDKALNWAGRRLSDADVARTVAAHADISPPEPVLNGRETSDAFAARSHSPYSFAALTARECILLHLALFNRAARPFHFLFDAAALTARAPYETFLGAVEDFLEGQPSFAALDAPLLKVLRAPIEAAPDSLEAQLDYIRRHWTPFLPDELQSGLLLARDVIREETAMRGWGPGAIEVLRFGTYADDGYPEPEAFSKDVDWMSNVVLMAKSTHVWLHQLSRAYGRDIQRLDQIPDEELDKLARWGFTSLWLIGLWERSSASRQIKQMTGNPEALASAYSLYDYEIAQDLGGHGAYEDLRDRAWRRGIRLASDMVPNHMGVYSKWVIEHPDWFIQLAHPPYPGYSFTGADLSQDERVCIQIEDGYWDQRDAAVVFRRLDKWTGEARYIYHGNDGTSTPWNDTAQLNFLLPEVRETVVQTILHVARMFPVIRFDAAMTLAKRHYQRLWFPQPGDAGAVPSRAEFGMAKPDFDAVFPKEFWREVVDRIAEEVPDTLLLAEAFWLMEGYFVRTLGMHRVYNSAFMNMLKMEENSKYRQTVKNVLEFSPEVLKRFVNFMNNPDERTAVEQFGKGDKYIGVALMMATMPGLPMFGHGQVEGFTEKYGMEYSRSYYDEIVDEHLVRRHEAEVFPLMRRRRLFSGVEHFALYDFETGDGWVDENVFAYSNRTDDERALIVYNNAYGAASGWVRRSTGINVGPADAPHLISRTLAEALAINAQPDHFWVFRDRQSGLEFIREGRDLAENGLYVELGAYHYHAFVEFREVYDGDGSCRRLAERLNGAGVPDMADAWREMQLAPVLEPLRALLDGARITALAELASGGSEEPEAVRREALLQDAGRALAAFLDAASSKLGFQGGTEAILDAATRDMTLFVEAGQRLAGIQPDKKARAFIAACIPEEPDACGRFWREAAAWVLLRRVGALLRPDDVAVQTAVWMDEWMLRKPVREALEQSGAAPEDAQTASRLLRIVLKSDALLDADAARQARALADLFEDHDGRAYLNVNRHEEVVYFRKESFEELVHRLAFCRLLASLAEVSETGLRATMDAAGAARALLQEAERAGYQVQGLLDALAPVPSGEAASPPDAIAEGDES